MREPLAGCHRCGSSRARRLGVLVRERPRRRLGQLSRLADTKAPTFWVVDGSR